MKITRAKGAKALSTLIAFKILFKAKSEFLQGNI